MRLSYKFTNLLGCSYRKGNLTFSKDGQKLFSPVGNRVSVFDLKNNRTETLETECNYNVLSMALSPNNSMLILIDETGKAVFMNMASKKVIHAFDFKERVNSVSFCPNGKKFAITKGNEVVLYKTPGQTPELNPFIVDKRYNIMHGKTTSIDWSTDSKVFCVGCGDMNTYVIAGEKFVNLSIKTVGGHKDAIISSFFEEGSLDFYSLSELGELCVWKCDTLPDQLVSGRYKKNSAKNLAPDQEDEEEEEGDNNNVNEKNKMKKKGFLSREGSEGRNKGGNGRAEEDDDGDDESNSENNGYGGVEKKKAKLDAKPEFEAKTISYKRLFKYNFKSLLTPTNNNNASTPEKAVAADSKKSDNNNNKPEDKETEEVTKSSFNLGGGGGGLCRLKSAAFHKKTRMLVTGFESGIFFIHDMPSFSLIHSLSISDVAISTITIDGTGDWIALGCSSLGQLLVWEWQSQCYVLKQQGHFSCMNCLAYSPEGQYIATGGEDAKVKVWNTSSSFCFVTFNQHTSNITGVAFKRDSQVVLSCSLDGTVRAFDLTRYRNFRTFTAPERTSTQFSCLALDATGDVVCAGSQDTFEIYAWSMINGSLLNVLAGHEGPVSSLMFSPVDNLLASGSWDHTVRLWPLYSNKAARDVIQLSSDALCVSFRPDGQELAVATLDGQISFWDARTTTQTHSIEGRSDLGYSRMEGDKITAKKSALGKAFTTLCYTADGKCILAGGRSKNICIYSVEDQILVKRFPVTCNLSLHGTQEFLDRRKMTEWGNLNLVDTGEIDGEKMKSIALPGVRSGEFSSRFFKPEVRVLDIQFSPTGMAWSAATTEGLLIYSLVEGELFDPYQLTLDLTPTAILDCLAKRDYLNALMMAFRLADPKYVEKVMETVPTRVNGEEKEEIATGFDDESMIVEESEMEKEENKGHRREVDYKGGDVIAYICDNLADVYIDRMIDFLAKQLETSRHLQFYLTWTRTLLLSRTCRLKMRGDMATQARVRALQKSLARVVDLDKLMDHNLYLLEFLMDLQLKAPYIALDEKLIECSSDIDNDNDNSISNDNDVINDVLFNIS